MSPDPREKRTFFDNRSRVSCTSNLRLGGIAFFHERLSLQEIIGLFLGVAAVVLLGKFV